MTMATPSLRAAAGMGMRSLVPGGESPKLSVGRNESARARWQQKATVATLPQKAAGTPARRASTRVLARAATAPSDGVQWWEKDGGPNFVDIHSTQEFVEALANAGDKLVVAEFFASWCGSCRALYPKLCKLAAEHPDVQFLKVNFDENKPMCKSLNIKVLPYFHFYRGADGRLEGFSCSLSKLQKLRDAIALHNTERCSMGPPVGENILLSTSSSDQPTAATASSS